jgi:hypothetical protein
MCVAKSIHIHSTNIDGINESHLIYYNILIYIFQLFKPLNHNF